MNIGIVSGGGFQGLTLIKDLEVFRKRKPGVFVTVLDVHEDNVGKYFADAFVRLPYLNHPAFDAALLGACRDGGITHLLPSTERELPRLAALRETLRAVGVGVLSPDGALLNVLQHKSRTYAWAAAKNIPVLPTVDADHLANAMLPLIAKPNEGWGGRGVATLKTKEDVAAFLKNESPEAFCVQPMLEDFEEHSVDFAIRSDGLVSSIIVRRRDLTSGGFAVISHTVEAPEVTLLAERTAAALAADGAVGMFNVQFLGGGGDHFLSDVNPRLGTSATFSTAYGFSFVEFLVEAEPRGDVDTARRYKCVRFLDELWIDGSQNLDGVKTIAFDLDDTLFNQKHWMFDKLRGALAALPSGVDPVAFTNAAHMWLEESRKHDWFDLLARDFGLVEAQKLNLVDAFRRYVPNGNYVFADVTATLSKLKERYKIALVTDGRREPQEQKVKHAGIEKWFDAVVYNETNDTYKPAAAGFHRVCEATGVSPNDCVMIGDNSVRDVLGSLNAGFRWAFWLKRQEGFLQFNKALFDTVHNQMRYSELRDLRHLAEYFK